MMYKSRECRANAFVKSLAATENPANKAEISTTCSAGPVAVIKVECDSASPRSNPQSPDQPTIGDDTSVLSQLRCTIDCRQAAVRNVCFSADGCFCMTAGADKTIKLWSPHRVAASTETAAAPDRVPPLRTYLGHGDEARDVHGSCDNGRLVSGGGDRAVVVWDVATGRQLNKWREHRAAVHAVRFNETAGVVVSASGDGRALVWDCRQRQRQQPLQALADATDSVQTLAVSDHEIVTGSADGRLRRYDLRNGRLCCDTLGSEPVTCATLTRDGQCVLAACLDANVRLLDKSTGQLLNSYCGHRNVKYPLACCLDSDDATVLAGSEDGRVVGWNLVSARRTLTLPHPRVTGTVHALSFHPHQQCLLTAAAGAIYMWGCEIQV